MANVYKDISEFVQKVAATGNEEFQVSATEKVTAQQIADLASSGLNVYTISESESQNQKIDASRVEELKKSELVLFPNGVSYIPYFKVSLDNSKAYFITGNMPINSQGQPGINNGEEPPFEQVQTVMIEVDLTTYDIAVWPYPVIEKSWFKGDVSVIEITDFAIPSVNITKDGQSFLFYANDASNIPNSNHGATSFVGVAIASPIFITGDQRLLYYMMVDTARGMFYTGYADTVDDTVAWNTTPITRLGQAVQVTAFTEAAFGALLYSYKPGDFIPFYTNSVTASEANQFPESGVFNGFISMGSNEGDYFQIFAFKTGSPKAYIGACIGSTTQWTLVGGGSGGGGGLDVINVPMGGDIGSIIAGANWKQTGMEGEMKAVFVLDPASVVGDYFPNLKNAQTLAGFAQCVYDGSDYQYFITTLFPYTDTLRNLSKEYGRILSETNGDVIDYEEYPYCGEAPIPGYSTLVNVWRGPLVKGSTGVINFNAEIPTSSKILVVAKLRSSTATTANVVANIPITFVDVNSTGQGIILDYTNLFIGKNGVPGSIRLICSSVITGATGVQGMNFALQVSNVSDVSNILEIAMYSNR